MLKYDSSEAAAASVLLALKITNHTPSGASPWPDSCEKHSGYSMERLVPIALKLKSFVIKAAQPDAELKAVNKKFLSSKFGEVAKLTGAALPSFP
jgi:hypothetical protein